MTPRPLSGRLTLYIQILASLALYACTTPPATRPQPETPQQTSDPALDGIAPTPAEDAAARAQLEADAKAEANATSPPAPTTPSTAPATPPQPVTPEAPMLVVPSGQVTSLSFGQKSSLHVGFRDSAVLLAEFKRKRGKLQEVYTKPLPVLSVSPNGKLAIVQTSQGKVVRTRDGQVMLELNDLERMESAQFTPDGLSLLITDNKGQLHVWKQAHELDSIIERDPRLQIYVARQSPNFSATFGQLAGPLYTNGDQVLFARRTGQILLWDMNNPTAAITIMRQKVPISSMSLQGDYLLSTSSGELRVNSIKSRQPIDWSKTSNADLIATTPKDPDHFIALEGKTLSSRNLKDGKPSWSVDLDYDGEPCGLSIDADAKYIAVCVADKITVHEYKAGKLYRRLSRDKDKLSWK